MTAAEIRAAYLEGRDAAPMTRNPYAGADATAARAWLIGYTSALRARNDTTAQARAYLEAQ